MDITFWTWVPPPTKAKLLLMSAMVTLNLPIFSNDVFFVQYSYFEISFPKCNLLVTDYVYYYFNLKTSVLKYIFCVWNLLWSSFGMWRCWYSTKSFCEIFGYIWISFSSFANFDRKQCRGVFRNHSNICDVSFFQK